MGTGEESTSAKPSKPVSSTQEVHITPPYPDWSNSMQAYYGPGSTPPPFFAQTVASPAPHPYLWGGQHPLIPPYGTPVPYPALYPSGGVYAHPNMGTPPTVAQANTELDGKRANGKDQTSAKKSKGPSGTKGTEGGKATSGSGNEGVSQSAESGSDGSSNGSDENTIQQDVANKKGSFNQMLADASANVQASVPGNPVGAMPATNLNIGMDLWSASPASGAAKLRPNPPGGSSALVPPAVSEQWIQDERELKRQKRKQSNRESARRSRLRKQAECEELQTKVENLSKDNHNLREELQRLTEECGKLKSENDSIKDELLRIYGPDAIADIEQNDPAPLIQSNGMKQRASQ